MVFFEAMAICMADASTCLPSSFRNRVILKVLLSMLFDILASDEFDAVSCEICLCLFSKSMLALKWGLFTVWSQSVPCEFILRI